MYKVQVMCSFERLFFIIAILVQYLYTGEGRVVSYETVRKTSFQGSIWGPWATWDSVLDTRGRMAEDDAGEGGGYQRVLQ